MRFIKQKLQKFIKEHLNGHFVHMGQQIGFMYDKKMIIGTVTYIKSSNSHVLIGENTKIDIKGEIVKADKEEEEEKIFVSKKKLDQLKKMVNELQKKLYEK
jgi:capsular polysaccharide biosynthesis protein